MPCNNKPVKRINALCASIFYYNYFHYRVNFLLNEYGTNQLLSMTFERHSTTKVESLLKNEYRDI